MIRKSQLILNHEILNSLGTSKRQGVGVDVKIVMNALARSSVLPRLKLEVVILHPCRRFQETCPSLRQMTGRAGYHQHSSGMKNHD